MANATRSGSANPEGEFSAFLALLAADPLTSAARCERMRRRLIIFFATRSLANADLLSDQAIHRLAQQIPNSQMSASIETSLLAIADQIADQQGRLERKRPRLESRQLWYISQPSDPIEEEEARIGTISDCLRQLSDYDRELLKLYYSGDRTQQFSLRRSLSATLQLSGGALRKRAVRLRAAVEDCARQKDGAEKTPKPLQIWLHRTGNSR